MKPSVSYKKGLLEDLKDQQEAVAYLDAALEDEDNEVFLLALRDVAESRVGLNKLDKQVNLKGESLYSILSESGNPQLSSLLSILRVIGLKLSVKAA